MGQRLGLATNLEFRTISAFATPAPSTRRKKAVEALLAQDTQELRDLQRTLDAVLSQPFLNDADTPGRDKFEGQGGVCLGGLICIYISLIINVLTQYMLHYKPQISNKLSLKNCHDNQSIKEIKDSTLWKSYLSILDSWMGESKNHSYFPYPSMLNFG